MKRRRESTKVHLERWRAPDGIELPSSWRSDASPALCSTGCSEPPGQSRNFPCFQLRLPSEGSFGHRHLSPSAILAPGTHTYDKSENGWTHSDFGLHLMNIARWVDRRRRARNRQAAHRIRREDRHRHTSSLVRSSSREVRTASNMPLLLLARAVVNVERPCPSRAVIARLT